MQFFMKKEFVAVLIFALIVAVNGFIGHISKNGTTVDEKQRTAVEKPVNDAAAVADPEVKVEKEMMIHIDGAVVNPGVYHLVAGSRINDALQKAGGFSDRADHLSVNLAEKLQDGQQIIVLERGANSGGAVNEKRSQVSGSSSNKSVGGKVSINRGTSADFQTLDGVGEKTAEKIISYRKSQGGFKKLEELMNVPGIGQKKFDKMKDKICL